MMTTLFKHLLAERFDLLPEPVRRFHTLERELFTGGRSKVSAEKRGVGAALLAFVAGLPAPGDNVETHVRFTPLAGAEEFWRRDFAGRRYESVMEAAADGCLIEHFGPFDLYFELAASPAGLRWSLSDWRLLKIPLPSVTRPRIDCFESAEGGRFTFDIDVAFPIVGHVVHYSGSLTAAPEDAPIFIYDGVCVLCDWSVRYVLAHEITPSIRFVAIQSAEGRALARAAGVDPDDPESFLFVENGRLMKETEALLALARQLRGPARAAPLARLLPRFIADALYRLVARNRYRWFGRKAVCALPEGSQSRPDGGAFPLGGRTD
jgi:predicted DCC family thiol-disulfide oxidoreductase YuxK